MARGANTFAVGFSYQKRSVSIGKKYENISKSCFKQDNSEFFLCDPKKGFEHGFLDNGKKVNDPNAVTYMGRCHKQGLSVVMSFDKDLNASSGNEILLSKLIS